MSQLILLKNSSYHNIPKARQMFTNRNTHLSLTSKYNINIFPEKRKFIVKKYTKNMTALMHVRYNQNEFCFNSL